MSRFRCTSCDGDPDKQPDCRDCGGSGHLRDVPYAQDPWNEIIPGLWVGGHDYHPAGEPMSRLARTKDLAEAGFDVVISFYRYPGCEPPEGVEAHYHRIVDGLLTPVEIEHVEMLAYLAADRVRDGKKVLIRCQAGLNRSSFCAVMALGDLGFDPALAIELIRSARSPYALCNGAFVDYLLLRKRDAS